MSVTGGMHAERLAALMRAVRADIDRGMGNGAALLVARAGKTVLHEAYGVTDPDSRRAIGKDSVFNILSLTKALTNLLVMQSIERGELTLWTPVARIIPEFAGYGRDGITIYHLLTHTSGLPTVIAPLLGPDAAILAKVVAAVCAGVKPVAPPGEQVSYAPAVGHVLLAEVVRRLDPAQRTFRAILQQDLLEPLGMADTALGLPAALSHRHVPLRFLVPPPNTGPLANSLVPQMWQEGAEMPWVGAVSTVDDVFRLAEMLRLRGTSGKTRIVSPAMLELATRNHTGERPNNLYSVFSHANGWGYLPAYIGLGFFLRGETIGPNRFGTLTSPRTFGHTGAGSTLFWIDPERELTFIFLSAGLLDEGENFRRFSRYSDMVVAAAE